MEYKLLGVSGLILIILLLTWLKDGENMNPPLERRAIIDFTTIAIFWIVYEFYNFSRDKAFEEEVVMIINLALLFFLARMIQLIAQLNPMVQEFVSFLKKKGIKIDEIDDEKGDLTMALKTQQTVTLTGASEINGVQIAYFNASIPQGVGSSTISRNITNQDLYDANRTEVRADEAEFQGKVYAIEDSLLDE